MRNRFPGEQRVDHDPPAGDAAEHDSGSGRHHPDRAACSSLHGRHPAAVQEASLHPLKVGAQNLALDRRILVDGVVRCEQVVALRPEVVIHG
jgi:hypothetical protein